MKEFNNETSLCELNIELENISKIEDNHPFLLRCLGFYVTDFKKD